MPGSCTRTGVGQLRQLGAEDLPAIERHLLGLGLRDRQSRFHGAVADTTIAAYVRRINPARSVLVGASVAPTDNIIGLAEAHPAEAPRTVEMAVSVPPLFRHRGLGSRLVTRATELAFAHGAETAEFVFAPDNQPIVALMRGLGARMDSTRGQAWISTTSPDTSTGNSILWLLDSTPAQTVAHTSSR
jgi:ribosomal protein S18 acetylase RimI-like enzyme